MKFIVNLIKLRQHRSVLSLLKLSAFCIILLTGFNLPGYSQQKTMQPSWWFGVVGGANFNAYHGYTSALNVDINASPAFDRGYGFGGYFAALIQYHQPGAVWGVMLQQGADNRRGNFEKSGRRMEAKISYFSTEPSIMFMVPKSSFYFYAGPRVGFLWATPFTYNQPNSSEYPAATRNPKAFIKNFEKITISAQAGVGYDLRVLSGTLKEQFIIVSPFVTYLPALNQNIRTIETLKLNTIRAGMVLKTGRAPKY